MGFHQIFLLKNINDAWVCTNDMFRLALHNFGWAGDAEAPVLFFFSSSSSLTDIIHTHGTFQISYTNLQHCRTRASKTCDLPFCWVYIVTRWVPCAWCLEVRLSCIWQEKFVLYQHASERIYNAKGCCLCTDKMLYNPKKWKNSSLYSPVIDLFRCFNATLHNKTMRFS